MNSWVVRRVGERRGGAARALGLALLLELTEVGQVRAADGEDMEEAVEAKQHEREREREDDRRKREKMAYRWAHRHMAST
jgi:hypothetical protein